MNICPISKQHEFSVKKNLLESIQRFALSSNHLGECFHWPPTSVQVFVNPIVSESKQVFCESKLYVGDGQVADGILVGCCII